MGARNARLYPMSHPPILAEATTPWQAGESLENP